MSKFKVGDRVRVVIEGRVSAVGTTWVEINEDFHIQNDVGSIVSIEVIEPPFVLPTKKYAQVVSRDGVLFTLLPTRLSGLCWKSEDGAWMRTAVLEAQTDMRTISEGIDE